MKLLLILLTVFAPALLFAQITGSDNFDDNVTDPDIWLEYATGDGLLQDANSRLEFTGTGASTNHRYWANASYDSDFEIIFKSSNTVDATLGTYPSIGIEIYPAGRTDLLLNVRNSAYYVNIPGVFTGSSRDIIANFYNNSVLNPATPVQPNIWSAFEIGIRLYYESDSSVITLYYDDNVTNGYQWTEWVSFGIDGDSDGDHNQDFGITSGTAGELEIALYGSASNIAISSGQMYIDDFVANQVLSYDQPEATIATAVVVDFDSQWNGVYSIEKTTDLENASFNQVRLEGTGTNFEVVTPSEEAPANSIIGTGETMRIIDFTTNQNTSFYRVVLEE